MRLEQLEWIRTYAPIIYFDKKEPFFPVKVGVTLFNAPGVSPSFPREIDFIDVSLQQVIEYAIYWDYDIQHLYELEHVWIYIGRDGEVLDCEASFHGRFIKGLLKDKHNLEHSTHVKLYSQPGKHAFSPIIELFELLPDLKTSTYAHAGWEGLIVTDLFKGIYSTSAEKNVMVYRYLQQFKFKPSMEFTAYEIPEEIYVSWDELFQEIPHRIEERLQDIGKGRYNGQN